MENRTIDFMFSGNLTTVGASVGLTIPAKIMRQLNLKKGDFVFVTIHKPVNLSENEGNVNGREGTSRTIS